MFLLLPSLLLHFATSVASVASPVVTAIAFVVATTPATTPTEIGAATMLLTSNTNLPNPSQKLIHIILSLFYIAIVEIKEEELSSSSESSSCELLASSFCMFSS